MTIFKFDSLYLSPMNKLTKYKEIESFLFRQLPMFQRVGAKAFKTNLDNIKQLSKVTGQSHKHFKSIHIAGTNGKGSTSYFLATALQAQGYKVGLYTSPHYKDYRERIKIDGKMISKSFVKQFVNQLIEDKVLEGELKPSFFEITVAMAFSYFKEERVDIAIIETGLGGRLDSTNIITPVLSVITNIGLDHTAFLGDTLPKIAKEKAGIIKKNVPVIIGRRQKETLPVFKKKAEQKKTKLIFAQAGKWPEALDKLLKKFPKYQHENLKTAFTTLKRFDKSIAVETLISAWTKGLKEWEFIGRYMQVNKSPTIIFDSAHNPAGIKVLFNQLENENYKYLHIILAVVNDKDLEKVLPLFPKEAKYYFSQAKIPRALNKEILRSVSGNFNLNGKVYSSVSRAFSAAKRSADKKDLILVAGSIFTVAEVV